MDVDYMAGEDDFGFGFEDEKWMMGEFDLDVDLGRPIDFEGEGLATDQDDSGFQDAKSSGNADPRKETPSGPGLDVSAPAQRTVTFSVPGRNNDVGNTGLGASVNGDNSSAQRSGGFNLADPTSKGVVNPSRPANDLNPNGNHNNGNKELNLRSSGGNGTSIGNGNNRGQPLNGSIGHGNGGRTNLSNPISNVQPSGSGNNRPSAGGFTFPPSIVRVISLSSLYAHKADEPNPLDLFRPDRVVFCRHYRGETNRTLLEADLDLCPPTMPPPAIIRITTRTSPE